MNWGALKNGKCPQCNNLLQSSGLALGNVPALKCSKSCGFKISEKRLTEILQKKPSRHQERSDEQNLSDLNNLGHREQSEGFEDSPHLDY